MLLSETNGTKCLPSAFLFDVECNADESWQKYSRYQPAPDGKQFHSPPVPFPLEAGAPVTILDSVLPVVVDGRGPRTRKAVAPHTGHFLGVILGKGVDGTRRWAMVQSADESKQVVLAGFNTRCLARAGHKALALATAISDGNAAFQNLISRGVKAVAGTKLLQYYVGAPAANEDVSDVSIKDAVDGASGARNRRSSRNSSGGASAGAAGPDSDKGNNPVEVLPWRNGLKGYGEKAMMKVSTPVLIRTAAEVMHEMPAKRKFFSELSSSTKTHARGDWVNALHMAVKGRDLKKAGRAKEERENKARTGRGKATSDESGEEGAEDDDCDETDLSQHHRRSLRIQDGDGSRARDGSHRDKPGADDSRRDEPRADDSRCDEPRTDDTRRDADSSGRDGAAELREALQQLQQLREELRATRARGDDIHSCGGDDSRPADSRPDDSRPDDDDSRRDDSRRDDDDSRRDDSRRDDSRRDDSRPDDSRRGESRPDDSRCGDARRDYFHRDDYHHGDYHCDDVRRRDDYRRDDYRRDDYRRDDYRCDDSRGGDARRAYFHRDDSCSGDSRRDYFHRDYFRRDETDSHQIKRMKKEHFMLSQELHETASEDARRRLKRERAGIEYELRELGVNV